MCDMFGFPISFVLMIIDMADSEIIQMFVGYDMDFESQYHRQHELFLDLTGNLDADV